MFVFPHAAFRSIPTFRFMPRNVDGGFSMDRSNKVIGSAAGYWRATISNCSIHDTTTNRLWQAIDGMLEGRLGSCKVQACEGRRQPVPDGTKTLVTTSPFDDGASFDDGAEFIDPLIVADVFGSVALGSATMTIRVRNGSQILPGHVFSHWSIDGGHRIYSVKTVESRGVAGGHQTATVKIKPPARAAMAAGDLLEFDAPLCDMHLSDDNAMAVAMERGRFGTATLVFDEVP
ncbi:hypothetical protein [Jiella pelagia]|uniref:Uncharacterized protein n=1 Tax=Jiella pelagia TaxID=2986949 RepID=A0ABY7C082_9HYPH|nr:hypothetical protein [Jiella pelagia]WAP67235.1 hypothetical protein OH818_16800 [Jiella pelagia]